MNVQLNEIFIWIASFGFADLFLKVFQITSPFYKFLFYSGLLFFSYYL